MNTHQWNVGEFIILDDENDEFRVQDRGSIQLGDEDHFDDDVLFSKLQTSGHIAANTPREDVSFDGGQNQVYVMKLGRANLILERDHRWG